MKSAGVGYAALIAVLLAAALIWDYPLCWFGFYCLTGLAVLSFLLLLLARRHLSVDDFHNVLYAQPHEDVTAELTIGNRSWLPVGGVTVRWGKFRITATLMPRTHRLCPLRLTFPHTGVYPLADLSAWATDILGLFTLPLCRRKVHAGSCVTVMPQVPMIRMAAYPSYTDGQQTENGDKLSDDGDEFTDIRYYRPGDPMRRVHWKSSLRHGAYLIKQYESRAGVDAVLLLDPSVPFPPERFEIACDTLREAAAAVIGAVLRQGRSIALAAFDDAHFAIFEPDEAPLTFRVRLAQQTFTAGESIDKGPTPLALPFGQYRRVYVLTCLSGERWQLTSESLHSSVTLLRVVDGTDRMPSSAGVIAVPCGGDVAAALNDL